VSESLFLNACRRKKTTRTPIWIMRQAGRYMKEYRAIRERHSFLTLCKDSDLAAEVTVHAVEKLDVDAAIIFSDILLILQPMGLPLTYAKGEGPIISRPVRNERDVLRLKKVAAPDPLPFLSQAIRKTRAALRPDIPLIGFSGAPFTLASYMIEGGAARHFLQTKSFMYSRPDLWHLLMEKIVGSLIHSLNAQITAGVQAVQIFDSWVGCLSPADYKRYVLPYSQRVIRGVKRGVPVIHFGTQTDGLLELLRDAGGDVIGLDWRMHLPTAWKRLGAVAIQGNLDPTVLFAKPAEIRKQVRRILDEAQGKPGHIFNLGHGVLPTTPVENVQTLVHAVKEMSRL
jgi:uroporphyrinogen decarboxylase